MDETVQNTVDISIDLGTCNIKAAVFKSELRAVENGDIDKIEVLDISSNQGKSDYIPNIVNIGQSDVRIGEKNSVLNETVVDKLKRHIEEDNWSIYVPQRQKYMNVDEILVEEFEWLKKRTYEETRKYPANVILTAPVCFSEMQKERMKKAAEAVNMHVVDVITEPFGGLFANWQMFTDKSQPDHNILVFDFGGGTLDISIFSVSYEDDDVEIETLSSKGIRFGGDDITSLIIKKLFEEKYSDKIKLEIDKRMKYHFLDSEGFSDEDKNPDSKIYQEHYKRYSDDVYGNIFTSVNDLKESVCTRKHMRSTPDEEEIYSDILLDELNKCNITLSYSQLEKFLGECDIKERICGTVESLIDDAMLDTEDIGKVMMIGGTSKIVYFRKILEEVLEIPDDKKDDVFINIRDKEKYTAVAVGALTYMKFNNVSFSVTDRLAYEIGIFSNGEYMCIRTPQMTVNEWTSGRRNFIPEKAGDGSLRLKMYQIFNRKEYDEPIYMGYFPLDSDVFSPDLSYKIEICACDNRVLKGRFYDPRHKIIEDSPLAELELITEV